MGIVSLAFFHEPEKKHFFFILITQFFLVMFLTFYKWQKTLLSSRKKASHTFPYLEIAWLALFLSNKFFFWYETSNFITKQGKISSKVPWNHFSKLHGNCTTSIFYGISLWNFWCFCVNRCKLKCRGKTYAPKDQITRLHKRDYTSRLNSREKVS